MGIPISIGTPNAIHAKIISRFFSKGCNFFSILTSIPERCCAGKSGIS